MKTTKKRLTVAVSVMMVLVFAITMTGCGGGGASSVVNAFFDAIDKQDVKKFYNCFEEDVAEMLREFVDDDMMKDQLEMLDEILTDEYGKNWRSKIKVGKAEEVDKDGDVTYYEVKVTMEDEDDYIPVVKIKGKYYIDQDAMGSWF